MTQASRPQASHVTSFPLPSDPGPYSADQWAQLFQILYTGDQQATQGPLIRYLNELEVTDNGTTAVYVDTGAGIVNGHVLISSEQETWAIPAGPAGGRQDRVVMVENNSNVEVTQSTAARPLLFPNDLSEYTATPGVPPYSARLAILRGDDLNNLPVIDQTAALYMVELARYSINNAPTISAQVDYRDFCEFSTEVVTAMIADLAITTAKIDNLAVTTAKIDDDAVDDTKAGDRVPQLYRRQGGSATTWDTAGVVDRIPGAVRIVCGAIQWTGGAATNGDVTVLFPIAFSYIPLVFATPLSEAGALDGEISVSVDGTTTTTVSVHIGWRSILANNFVSMTIAWFAIGPE